MCRSNARWHVPSAGWKSLYFADHFHNHIRGPVPPRQWGYSIYCWPDLLLVLLSGYHLDESLQTSDSIHLPGCHLRAGRVAGGVHSDTRALQLLHPRHDEIFHLSRRHRELQGGAVSAALELGLLTVEFVLCHRTLQWRNLRPHVDHQVLAERDCSVLRKTRNICLYRVIIRNGTRRGSKILHDSFSSNYGLFAQSYKLCWT